MGHLPERSPYQDVRPTHNLTLSYGWLGVRRDPVGVAPRAGGVAGVRYDVNVGGPASLFARYHVAPSSRDVLRPGAPVAERVAATRQVRTHLFDGGLDVALTGRKSWHRLVPSVSAGLGVLGDFAGADSSGYRFGTKFLIQYGAAVRFLPRPTGPSLRLDVENRLWQYQYPDVFGTVASDGSALLANTSQRTAWRGAWSLSAGLTVPLTR